MTDERRDSPQTPSSQDQGYLQLDWTVNTRAEHLSQTGWTKGLEWPQVVTFCKYLDDFLVKSGRMVLKEGSREIYLGILIEGSVAVLKEGVDGKQKVLSNLSAGETFGEISLIDGEPRSASILAIQDSVLFVLPQKRFERLQVEVPKLGMWLVMKLARQVSCRLRRTSGTLVEVLETLKPK